jgi:hypothetical protein
MKKNLLNLLLVLTGFSVFAQPTRTVKDGNWSDPTVWDRGVPTSTTDARVMHNIVIDVNASVRTLLDLSPGGSIANSKFDLEIYGDLVVSNPSGWLESGTGKTVLRGTSSSISGKIVFNRLNIFKNRKDGPHTVTLNDSIFVTKYFYLNRGNVDATGFPIVLVANSTTEGNLGYSPEGNLVGDLVWQKSINRCNEWSTYSTPDASPSLAQIASFSDMDGNGRRMIYTGFPDSDFPTFSFINTYFYDESTGYTEPTSTSNTLARGQGYWYWNSNEVNLSDGNPISQQWLIQLTLNGFTNEEFNFNLTNNNDGFNLVGNPYPGVLDWNHGSWSRTNLDNALYYWNTCTQSYASYVNGVGSNGGNRWIPAGQGFWVQAIGTPSLSVKPAALSIGTVSAKPLKNNEAEEELPYLSIMLNGDETVVRFTENASTDFDNGKDARKILTPSYVPDNSSIRTVLNGVNYSINTVPVEDLIIPLDVKGQGELTFTGANQFSDIDIYLEDRLTGELIDMKANQSYVFDNSATGYTHRFNIITKKSVLSTSTLNEQRLSVYPNPYSDVVTIMTNGQAFDKVEVYNILGELVMSETNTGLTSRQINVSKLNTGTYIIKVYNQNNEVGTFLTQKQ